MNRRTFTSLFALLLYMGMGFYFGYSARHLQRVNPQTRTVWHAGARMDTTTTGKRGGDNPITSQTVRTVEAEIVHVDGLPSCVWVGDCLFTPATEEQRINL